MSVEDVSLKKKTVDSPDGLDQIPATRRRTQLTAYPPQAQARALQWLQSFHFTEMDLPSLHADFFFQAEDGIRDKLVTGVQTCALPICFSGVSTGACIGHISPEALAGGPIGKLRDGDRVRIVIHRQRLEGSVDFVGTADAPCTPEEGTRILADRPPRPDLAPDPQLPDDTKLWAALVQASGGVWGGCVYDAAEVAAKLTNAARSAL